LASVKAAEDGVPEAADVADEELPVVAMIAADHDGEAARPVGGAAGRAARPGWAARLGRRRGLDGRRGREWGTCGPGVAAHGARAAE